MSQDRRELTAAEMTDLLRRTRDMQARAAKRRPKKISDVMSQLLARRGYAQVQSAEEIDVVWRNVAGERIARQTRVGLLQRGVLDIIVANSTWLQELTFQKGELLSKLVAELPNMKIKNLRFRAGAIQ